MTALAGSPLAGCGPAPADGRLEHPVRSYAAGRDDHRAPQQMAVGLVDDHLHQCVTQAVASSTTDGEGGLDEVATAIHQVVRL